MIPISNNPQYLDEKDKINDQYKAKDPYNDEKISDDPEPVPSDSTDEVKARYKQVLEYEKSMYDTYVELNLEEEELWIGFVTAFRPQSV